MLARMNLQYSPRFCCHNAANGVSGKFGAILGIWAKRSIHAFPLKVTVKNCGKGHLCAQTYSL